MNSSGIKRGLAASAVSALAVAGIPALASSASANAGETLAVVNVGPTLNGGDEGGIVRLKTNSGAGDFDGTTGELALANPNLNAGPDNGNQAVDIVGYTFIAEDAPGDSANDGLNEVLVEVAVTTSDTGATATYAIFIDEDVPGSPVDGDVDAGEARVQVSQATSGPVARLDVAPVSQSTSQGITSGAYTVTAKDAQGRTTQLDTGDSVAVTSSKAVEVPVAAGDATIDATELQDGTHSFTVTPSTNPGSLGTTTFTLDPTVAGAPTDPPNATATLVVSEAAAVNDADMIDIVTAADSWEGFGGGTLGGTTDVRVDQGSIKIDIKGSTPGGTVTLNLDGGTPAAPPGLNGIQFGGKQTATVSTVLDAQGNGSLTISPDAGTVQVGETIAVTGSFNQTINFERAEPTAVVSGQDLYFSALKATTTVTAKVVDQFGNAITTGFVAGYRDNTAPNAETPPGQVKPVGADGTVSFDFTDVDAAVGQSDTVNLAWVPDQFTPPSGTLTDTATIRYTATGQGADFNTSLDTVNTGVPTYKASDVTVAPLASDGVADTDATEYVAIAVTGAEPNQAVTLSVDNGALIVDSNAAGDTVAEGKSSVTVSTDGLGALPAGLRIIGTKSGVTTLTVESANRTETAQFTVLSQTDTTTARNVEVTGDDTVESGTTQVPFTVKVTDAFGNGVANVAVSSLNIQVTGPGQFQDSSGVTNADGELTVNVRADADAEGEIGITVTGLPNALNNQFGAGANQLDSAAAANSAPGFVVSANQDSATTTIEAAAPVKADPNASVFGSSKKGKDKIKVRADAAAAGAKVTIKGGGQTKHGVLNANGDLTKTFKDKNGNKKTKYKVTIGGTADTKRAKAVIKQK